MQEFVLVKGELFPEHECKFKDKYELEGALPLGELSIDKICEVCSKEAYESFKYYGGHSVFDRRLTVLEDGGVDAIIDLPKI